MSLVVQSKPKRKRKGKKTNKPSKAFVGKVKKSLMTLSENHYHDYFNGGTASTAGAIQDALVVAQGTSDVSRIGDSILLKSIHLRYHLVYGAGATTAAQFVRVMIIQWFDNSAPLLNGILTNTAAGVSIDSDYNMDYFREKKTLKVLYDRRHELSLQGPSGVVVSTPIKRFTKTINYISGVNTPIYGDIYFVILSDQAAAGTNPAYQMYMRIQWIDP